MPHDAELEAEVRELLDQDRKIDAIKLYREHTGAGLAEAKQAVEAMEQGRSLGQLPEMDSPSISQVHALMSAGKKIEAVKLYREITGEGLAEAVAAVEAIQRGQTPLHTSSLDAATSQQIHSLMAAGEKIEAIKIYRQATGASLKDAKDFVEGNVPPPRKSGTLDYQAEAQIRTSLEQGRKMEALRDYIEATGASVPEAKEALDTLARKHAIEPQRAGCLGLLLVTAVLFGRFLFGIAFD